MGEARAVDFRSRRGEGHCKFRKLGKTGDSRFITWLLQQGGFEQRNCVDVDNRKEKWGASGRFRGRKQVLKRLDRDDVDRNRRKTLYFEREVENIAAGGRYR